MLASGQASSTCVAQALGLSVSTMQRWLGASGLAFSTLVNKVRTELVQRHLDSPATPWWRTRRCRATARRVRSRGGSVGSLVWRRRGGESGRGGIDKESGLKVQVAARWAEQILLKSAWTSTTAEAR